MREPALKRFQTFNRPKPLSRPEFRLSFAKYEASLHPNNIQSSTTIGRPPSQPQAHYQIILPYRAAEPKPGRQEDEPC